MSTLTRVAGIFAAAIVLAGPPRLAANVILYSGNLRADANVTSCGMGCSLGPSNSDGDYAQWAAVVATFTVNTTTSMEAITYSYGGGTSLTGAVIAPGGLEPYLSLFDSSGNFLASTFFGTTCPPGAQSVGGNCFDVALTGVTLTPGSYQIALTAFENMSLAENYGAGLLSDGFTGLGNLWPGESLNYAFDVILPENSLPGDTPEPGTLALCAIGAALVFGIRRIGPRPID
uniref:PEP-CTERM protein-sorting domain-containing protein n=1 Tax=Solibacter usitatus (strain Ellin6076) TaxID=234267 RepID=Q027D8_SOLUE